MPDINRMARAPPASNTASWLTQGTVFLFSAIKSNNNMEVRNGIFHFGH